MTQAVEPPLAKYLMMVSPLPHQVSGVRRIWGMFSNYTTTVAKNVINCLTDVGERIDVKRKINTKLIETAKDGGSFSRPQRKYSNHLKISPCRSRQAGSLNNVLNPQNLWSVKWNEMELHYGTTVISNVDECGAL